MTLTFSADGQLAHDARNLCQALNLIMGIKSPMVDVWAYLEEKEPDLAKAIAEREPESVLWTCNERLVEVWRLCP